MSPLENAKTEVIKTDILVLGGGACRLLCDYQCKRKRRRRGTVDKGSLGSSGFSCMVSGLLRHFDPEKDDYEQVFREGIQAGEWINDQNWLEMTIKESNNRVRELAEVGGCQAAGRWYQGVD